MDGFLGELIRHACARHYLTPLLRWSLRPSLVACNNPCESRQGPWFRFCSFVIFFYETVLLFCSSRWNLHAHVRYCMLHDDNVA